jgi:hypothetical protein
LKSRIAADASKRIYSASRQCAPEPSSVTACQERIMAIEAERDADLERAEAQRLATPLRG